MTDSLSAWWVHTVGVHRLTSSGSRGDVYSPPLTSAPDTLLGFWRDGQKLVLSASGETVVSTAQFAFPGTAAAVPVGSQIVPPAKFGTALRKVIVSAIGDGGGQPTPDHQEIALL